jgi:uncharacterized membrane protein
MRFHSKWTTAGAIPVSSSHRIGSGLRLARIEEQSESMIKAYRHELFKLPIAAGIADGIAGK